MTYQWKKTTYNKETLNQLWMSIIGDAHDLMCRCETPFAHVLDNIFPEGHRDRDKSIREIIERDTQCLSGGTEEENHGLADIEEEQQGERIIIEEEREEDLIPGEELEELLRAADAAATR